MQNQKNTKHLSNPVDIFQSAKNFLEKRNPKEDSYKTTISKFLTKTSNKKKFSEKQYKFCKANISLEVRHMYWEAKFLRERKFQGSNTTFVHTKISVEIHVM